MSTAVKEFEWPTPRLEEWRYTNLSAIASTEWRSVDVAAPAASAGEAPAATLAGRATVELMFVNGLFVQHSGELPYVSASRVGNPRGGSALEELNAMHTTGGARINIPSGTIVPGFIHLLFVGDGDGIWSHPRNVIDVGANAQVTIVETYVGEGRYYTNPVTEIVAGEGAVIDHTIVVCDSLEAYHTGSLTIRQGRSSSVTARNISIGGALVRNDVNVILDGEGASLVLDGLFTPAGSQHIDNHTVIDHARPHCTSVELYKGVLDGNGRGIFDGRIIVRPGAQKTSSRQSNHNLLLSETAIVDSKPTLEIHNDDVKCNHGSTIGQLNEEALFYLRARGIGEAEARNLLVLAFASELVDRIKVEPVREQVGRALFRQIPERLPERRSRHSERSEESGREGHDA
ncbi:MAG: Fe-S cluster assembly protein SufD [Acidobacteriota bacterium]|jgi:Fe-S cluster assembly protein SufD|nr:Fe-S cluster assembly protein SufD [Acidobacteriota bacterium]